MMDTRRWGPGERIVFETYSRRCSSSRSTGSPEHEIFAEGRMGSGDYDKAVGLLRASSVAGLFRYVSRDLPIAKFGYGSMTVSSVPTTLR